MKKNKDKVNPLWGGRFEEGVSDLTLSYTSSVDVDKVLYEVDIKGSMAYAEALKQANVISPQEFQKIKKGLTKILLEIESNKFEWKENLEDVHMNIESALVKKAGNAAKKLHTGRSRNDQVATDLRMYINTKIDEILKNITSLQKNIINQAKKHHSSIMPGFTHLQIAQPVTFGHHMMAWYQMLERDYSRLNDAKNRMSVLPLGSAALAGSRYKINRNFLAKKLGFQSLSRNSIDAVSDRDFVIETASALSLLGIHLSRICEEIVLWSSSQFEYVYLSDEVCTGSSIMPQKKNPDVAELIRGGSSKTIASLMGLLSLIKNLPLSYNRDLQEDKEFIFNSIDYTNDSVVLLAFLIKDMKANTKKMEAECKLGQITATDLADYLVNKSMPFRKAHETVGKIVAYAESRGEQIYELEISELKKFSKLISKDVTSYLDPVKSINSRNLVGGTAPSQVKKEITIATKELAKR
ncbi:MAG TPA: argininosuccinate lyase [SAR86 cluster bacterium]|nr:argininosuccinate lyase [SAR86 cluster bacterium]